MRKILTTAIMAASAALTMAQAPDLPGYFADPTIKKFGDSYYIYATTDGVKLASGEPAVWVSRDLRNWYCQELDIKVPDGLTNCWAPDVVFNNGKYYYYMGNCQFGCNIYGYVSEDPLGPFSPINDGKPVIPVGTAKKDLPCLDAQFFTDDDGSLYSYFGTWCTSFGGLGWAKVDPSDMSTLLETGIIPTEQIPGVFEAAYMLKRNGKYILMYSSGDCRLSSYAVHYAWADSPTGPFHYGKNNPILKTEGYEDSPGHHSVIEIDGHHYIVYHRHDIPHSTGGEFRQVCFAEMQFESDTVISGLSGKVFPSETAPLFVPYAKADSRYHLVACPNKFNPEGVDYVYKAENAIDLKNNTMWKASSSECPQSITLELNDAEQISRVQTCFEYATYYYQYKIETSLDGVSWTLFADRTQNRRAGMPMVDDGDCKAKFIRVTITGTEKTGMYPAIWEINLFSDKFEIPALHANPEMQEHSVPSSKSVIVELDASKAGKRPFANLGTLGGTFSGKAKLTEFEGRKCWYFNGKSKLELSALPAKQLSWNAPFTVEADVLNPEIGEGECLVSWTSRDNMLMSSYVALYYGTSGYGAVAHGDGYVDLGYSPLPDAGKWHNIKLVFDGMVERLYVDGKLNREQPISLFVEPGKVILGTSGEPWEYFSGYISRLVIKDYAE